MSAWYDLVAGVLRGEPAGGRYWFGSPLFDRAEVKVLAVFTITAETTPLRTKYIQRVWLNGQPYTKPPGSVMRDLMKGGELRFEMGAEEKVWYRPTNWRRTPIGVRGGAAAF